MVNSQTLSHIQVSPESMSTDGEIGIFYKLKADRAGRGGGLGETAATWVNIHSRKNLPNQLNVDQRLFVLSLFLRSPLVPTTTLSYKVTLTGHLQH